MAAHRGRPKGSTKMASALRHAKAELATVKKTGKGLSPKAKSNVVKVALKRGRKAGSGAYQKLGLKRITGVVYQSTRTYKKRRK